MLPEEVPTAWVEKAARAVYESRRRAAKATSGVHGTDYWLDWNPNIPEFSELLEDQREALAAVSDLFPPDAVSYATAEELADAPAWDD